MALMSFWVHGGYREPTSLGAVQQGLRVEEVPIIFIERTVGVSKMSQAIVLEALWRLTQWGMRHRWVQLRHGMRAIPRAEAAASATTPARRRERIVP